METLKCFMCRNTVKEGLNGLARHFIIVHGLTLKRGIERGGFQCGQKECYRRFLHFFSLRDHIRKVHFSQEENYSDFSIENSESVSSYNNDIIINDMNMIINENDENKIYENSDNVQVLKFLTILIKEIL